jgi:hypothetical protein
MDPANQSALPVQITRPSSRVSTPDPIKETWATWVTVVARGDYRVPFISTPPRPVQQFQPVRQPPSPWVRLDESQCGQA